MTAPLVFSYDPCARCAGPMTVDAPGCQVRSRKSKCHLPYGQTLTLYPPRGFARALSPRRGPSVRPLRLAPWASGVAPRLIRTARARATIVQQSPKCENTDFCISCPATWRRSNKPKKANKNAKHGSHLLRSSPGWARPVRTDSRWYCRSGSICRQSLDHDLDGCREGSILCEASQLVMKKKAGAGGSEGSEWPNHHAHVSSRPQFIAARPWSRPRCARR